MEVLQNRETVTGAQIVADEGYSVSMQRKPGEVLHSPGVTSELAVLGFSEEKAKEVVAVILGDDEEDANARLKAADMVFKVNGTYAPEKKTELHMHVHTADPKALALAQEFEEKLKLNA